MCKWKIKFQKYDVKTVTDQCNVGLLAWSGYWFQQTDIDVFELIQIICTLQSYIKFDFVK